MMPFRRIWAKGGKRLLFLGVVSLALLACPGIHTALATEGKPLREVTLQLKWQHQFQFAGYYAAKEKGFYRDAGLDVKFVQRAPGMDITKEVLSDRADFGVSNYRLLLDYFKGDPVVVLGVIFQHSPDIFLSKAKAEITHPSDLHRKRIALGGAESTTLWGTLLKHGIRKGHIQVHDYTWTTEELINDEIDVLPAYLTDQPYDLKRRGIPVNIIRPASYGIDFYGDLLFTTQKMATEEPELAAAFAAASFKGWEYAMENPKELIGLIHSRYNTNKTYGQLSYEAQAMQELILHHLVEIGTMTHKRWRHIAATFSQLGMLETPRPLDEFLFSHDPDNGNRDTHWIITAAVGLFAFMVTILTLFVFKQKLKQGVARRTMELELNTKSLAQIIDLMPNMLYVKNRQGHLLLVNRTMADSIGTTVEELTGKLHLEVHPDKAQAKQMQARDLEVLDTAIPMMTMEEPYLHADGTMHWLQATRQPYVSADTGELAVMALFIDITERREAEAALKASRENLQRLNAELEDRVLDRTRNLQEAKGELEESLARLKQTQEDLVMAEKMAALGDLVAGVAHEINTPLGVGVTASSFLQDKIHRLADLFHKGELKKSELEQFIATGMESSSSILTNLERAADLIKSFKLVAADQSSEIPRHFFIESYIDEVLTSLRPKFKRTGITIENKCNHLEMYGYPGAFMQIITNLLVNSINHAYGPHEQGQITITGHTEGSNFVFGFNDDGVGIEASQLDKIFDPFYTTKRGQGGTGLGLHIVFNTVTQTLGGTIQVTSTPGQGTAFTITVPLIQKTQD